MADQTFAELMRYVGFDEQDAANLRVLGTRVDVLIPATLDRFFDKILSHAGTRSVLSGDLVQISRLRQSLADWMRGLFCGTYDADYWAARAAIGRTHVRVGLEQHYMFAAAEVLWQELEGAIRRSALVDAAAKLVSLHKLLTIELAIVMESFRESYATQVRQAERDAMRERLTEAEQLAQIGQLAASLAHEIKNPLAGISGAIQIIRDSPRLDDAHRPVLDEVLRQVSRLDRTVKDLLVYARPKAPRFRECDLEQLLVRALSMLLETPEMQRVHFEHVNSQKLPPLEADENQVEQLLTNLLLNAAHASPDGGLVRLITSVSPAGVRFTVEDRGQGMDEEVRRRAVEPFFTTKARGTGLGLPICRKIVETHGGQMTIHSVVGEGTEVTVDLPRHPPIAGDESK